MPAGTTTVSCLLHPCPPRMSEIASFGYLSHSRFYFILTHIISGMCRSHYLDAAKTDEPTDTNEADPTSLKSVYDDILPASMTWKPGSETMPSVMPLATFLEQGQSKGGSWHRRLERQARGEPLVSSGTQFCPWEKQLIVTEVALLAGTPNSRGCFSNLATAWGRENGFHRQIVCDNFARKGDHSRRERQPLTPAPAASATESAANAEVAAVPSSSVIPPKYAGAGITAFAAL